MFYDKITTSPEPGSLQEVACIIVQRYRQEQQLNAVWANLVEGPELKKQALEAYKKSLAPYIEKSRDLAAQQIRERMERYLASGPIFINLGDEDAQ